MPEIAEIARAVHFLRLCLVGKAIKSVTAPDDANVFGKVGTTGAAFESALTGRIVLSAGSQGKYFWLVMDKPPHTVMHFGMTGWIHVKGMQTAYTNYEKRMKEEDVKQWPPKFWKFLIKTDDDPAVEVAYTDPRRFGRVRLVDCPGDSIRKHSPLVENGPDPVVDTDVFTEEFLRNKMKSRHVPIKALILDQAVISGIGNWVGDEVLYHARLHPEQYCDEFGESEVKRLFDAIRYVCQLAVDKLARSDEFPDDWLFQYRWGKGKKHASSHLPNGEKLAFLTVGGRTSCYAPNVQKKTGRVVPGIQEKALGSDVETKPAKGGNEVKCKGKSRSMPSDGDDDEEVQPKKRRRTARNARTDDNEGKSRANTAKNRAPARKEKNMGDSSGVIAAPELASGRRRSGRLQAKAA